MKLFIVSFVIGCLAVTSAYGLEQDPKDRLIDIHNLTANMYALIIGLVNDLSDKKITNDTAANKIDEWKVRYEKETSPVPPEARKMCDLMNKMLNVTRETVRDYQQDNQRTKDGLNELEGIKSDLKNAMTELKYSIQ